jgi:hypothetical protein
VIVHFAWRQKSRNWLGHVVVPVVGFAINLYVLLNMAAPAKIAGIAWLAAGVIALLGIRVSGRCAVMRV